MHQWSLEILRQGGWDLWSWVCLAAALVMACSIALDPAWGSARGLASLILSGAGIGGTAIVLLTPALHTPLVGLVWTFCDLSLLSATFYLKLHATLGTARTATLLGMRICALALVTPMLFEPVLRYVATPRPERPLIFLIDTSGSMSIPDIANGPTRIQSVWQALRPELPAINQHFVPSYLTFDTSVKDLKSAQDVATLTADGKSTDIVTGLGAALAKSDRNDAQVVLISDGIDNTSPDVLGAIASAQRPVNTVIVGSDQAEPARLPNVAVDSVDADDDFVVGHESMLKASISSTALKDRVVQVQMAEVDDASKPIGPVVQQSLVLTSGAEPQIVSLPYKPSSVGVHRLAVWIDPIPGERTRADNRQEFQGLALDPRIKVLYIEGRVRPEYTQLNRALGRDQNIEAASLLRIQQDRFAASGTIDGEPLKTIPQTADQWAKVDVVIFGDLDSSFLGAAQQLQIEQRVENGGGLLMLGGATTLGPGGYAGTPLEKALPVYVGDRGSAQDSNEFIPQLTVDGLAHPSMEGLLPWFGSATQKAANQLPNLRGNVIVAGAKSGAQVLLVHPGQPGADAHDQIVLATENYGKGRSAVFTADTTYLWYLPLRGMGQDSPYNRFWGQLVRWLAGADVRNRQQGAGVVGLLNKSVYQFGETVKVRAMVRDERGDATQYAQVSMTVDPAPQSGGELPLKPSSGRIGLYQATVDNLQKGDYSVTIKATKDGKDLGSQTLKFTVIPPADEMLKLAANNKLMAAIADQTKGFNCPLTEFPTLIDELIRSDPAASTVHQRSVPLANSVRTAMELAGAQPQWDSRYDLPMQGALVAALLLGEWILRRKWQLA